jgi:uncharacterized membrane protein YkvA (DUF1232 family)
MSEMFGVIRLLVLCGTILSLAFVVLLAMPKSKLRAVLMQVVGWGMAAFCVLYGISPIDIMPEAVLGPFGLFDDLVAIGVAIASGSAALQAGRDLKEM